MAVVQCLLCTYSTYRLNLKDGIYTSKPIVNVHCTSNFYKQMDGFLKVLNCCHKYIHWQLCLKYLSVFLEYPPYGGREVFTDIGLCSCKMVLVLFWKWGHKVRGVAIWNAISMANPTTSLCWAMVLWQSTKLPSMTTLNLFLHFPKDIRTEVPTSA